MRTHRLGPWQVSAIGLGCMNVSWKGRAATDPERRYSHAIPGMHAALDSGVTFLDTANIYAPLWDTIGHNELVVKEAIDMWEGTKEQKDNLVVATKGGITRSEGEKWGRNGSLEHLLGAVEKSMANLGVDSIQLYQHHRQDPTIDLETQIENFGELKKRGLIQQIGLSNYSAEQLEVAIDILGGPDDGGVISIQNEFSPFYRNDLDVLDVCERTGIAFLPWSPLGGKQRIPELESGEFGGFAEMAAEKGVSVQRLVIAWLMHYSPAIIPIPGPTRPESVRDTMAAAEVTLSADEVNHITQSLPESLPKSDELLPFPPRRGA